MSIYHIPVLLQSVCTALNVQPGKKYIDATIGGGGHTRALVSQGGLVLGIDQDPDAIAACAEIPHVTLVNDSFIHITEIAKRYDWAPVHGIVFDLGVSWHQLTTPQRGFSFQSSGPLDMRMDPRLPHTAATLVNTLSEKQLVSLFRKFGEEPKAASIAKKIVAARPLSTTQELAQIAGSPQSSRRIFQALRIAVNDELTAIEIALPAAYNLLEPGGTLAVITFHSLEDRLVKQLFNLKQPPILPSLEEQSANPHSRSAKLRLITKI